LVLEPTSTAQWRQLVSEAQDSAHHSLDEELESYLVFLLMRYAQEPRKLATIVALEYLESLLARGQARRERLRDVGDTCLLFSGLFPNLARRRRVRISYYVHIGQGAYSELSQSLAAAHAGMFAHLSEKFVALMDVLHAMRRLGTRDALLTPIEAFDLHTQTGSTSALGELQTVSTATPIVPDRDSTH
jgi:hypothetical protein